MLNDKMPLFNDLILNINTMIPISDISIHNISKIFNFNIHIQYGHFISFLEIFGESSVGFFFNFILFLNFT